MPQDPQALTDLPVSTGLEGIIVPAAAPTSLENDALNTAPVNIPMEDVTARVAEVNQVEQVISDLKPEVQARVNAILRNPERRQETVLEYNERVKRDFTEQVMEARRQAAAPPPPPQPVPTAIAEKTRKEMEAGRKQSAYWAEQQKTRPLPSAADIAAAGNTVPVFQPSSYTHEKGEGFAGKQYTRSNTSGR